MAWTSSDQALGESQPYRISSTISQAIPEQWHGQAVVDLVVMERYSSYLLQRATLAEDNQTLWTPLYFPISWGWSIRAGRRYDGEWDIMRRKLMLPITGQDGLQFPLWRDNSLQCSRRNAGD
jgi:hypothetical protein